MGKKHTNRYLHVFRFFKNDNTKTGILNKFYSRLRNQLKSNNICQCNHVSYSHVYVYVTVSLRIK